MKPEHARLFAARDRAESYLGSARVTVASSALTFSDYIPVFRVFGTNDVRAQINGALDAIGKQLEKLEESGTHGAALLAGRLSTSGYAELVNVSGKAIESILRDVVDTRVTFENVWTAVVEPTIKESREVASEALDRGQSLGTTIAIIAVAVAVLYVTAKVAR